VLHPRAATGVDADGRKLQRLKLGGEGGIEIITPLPAEALMRRPLIENSGVAQPVVVPDGVGVLIGGGDG